MNRGSAASKSQLRRAWYCFNEAPIHESGKYGEIRIAGVRRRLLQ